MVVPEDPETLHSPLPIVLCVILILELYGSLSKSDTSPMVQRSKVRYSDSGWFEFKTTFHQIKVLRHPNSLKSLQDP